MDWSQRNLLVRSLIKVYPTGEFLVEIIIKYPTNSYFLQIFLPSEKGTNQDWHIIVVGSTDVSSIGCIPLRILELHGEQALRRNLYRSSSNLRLMALGLVPRVCQGLNFSQVQDVFKDMAA